MAHTSTDHAPHDAHGHDGGSHGSLKSYIVGLILSIVLTIVAFGAVMSDALSTQATIVVIVVTAVAQLLVQLVAFLHMGSKDQKDNASAFLFTGVIVAIIIGGSTWVMHNAHKNMMPDDREGIVELPPMEQRGGGH